MVGAIGASGRALRVCPDCRQVAGNRDSVCPRCGFDLLWWFAGGAHEDQRHLTRVAVESALELVPMLPPHPGHGRARHSRTFPPVRRMVPLLLVSAIAAMLAAIVVAAIQGRKHAPAVRHATTPNVALAPILGTTAGTAPTTATPAAAASLPTSSATHIGPSFTGTNVPVLMYHVVAEPPARATNPQLFVTPPDFAAQIKLLAASGYTAVTLDEVWSYWHHRGTLPAHPIVLSFDDGYRADYTRVLPMLEAQRWPGVLNLEIHNLFTPGGLTRQHVREMIAAGWELDSHTITHPNLTHVNAARLWAEVGESRERLQHWFGVPVNFFCPPAGEYDQTVIAAVRRAGYLGETTTDYGLASPGSPFTMRRIRVNGVDGAAGLAVKLGLIGSPIQPTQPGTQLGE
jgi:peptidoglycan/xylan/chitin deacetylase (PgdA/CDA1 family)